MSIDDPFDEPGVRGTLAEQAVGGAVTERHVPFVAIPLGVPTSPIHPPVSGRAPRPGTPVHGSTAQPPPIRRHPRGPAIIHTHARGDGKAEAAKRNGYSHGTPRHRGTEDDTF